MDALLKKNPRYNMPENRYKRIDGQLRKRTRLLLE